jgi:cytochrome c556
MQRPVKIMGLALAVLGAAGVFAVHSSLAAGKPTKAEMEVDYRQSLYTVIGGNFGPLGDMAGGKAPFDAAEAKKRAERVAFLAPLLKEAFPADSNGVAHTAAKPEIWTDTAGFNEALQLLIDRSAALAAAANGGDATKIKAAIADTGKACKGCHDKYRVKE